MLKYLTATPIRQVYLVLKYLDSHADKADNGSQCHDSDGTCIGTVHQQLEALAREHPAVSAMLSRKAATPFPMGAFAVAFSESL